MKSRSLDLHIGIGKTGSTAIQNKFAQEKSILLDSGIYFIDELSGPNSWILSLLTNTAEEIIEKSKKRRFHEVFDTVETLEDYLATKLEGVLLGTSANCFIISSENIYSQLVDESGLRRLHKLLSPFFTDIRIIVFTRSKKKLIKSHYFQSVTGYSGNTDSFRTFYRKQLVPFGYYDFNYRLGLYYRVFGEESVKHFVLSKQAPDAAKIFSDLKGIPYQNRVQSNKTPKKNQLLRFLVLNRWFSEISKNHQKNIIWRVLNKVLNVVYK